MKLSWNQASTIRTFLDFLFSSKKESSQQMIITHGNLISGLGNDPKKGYFKFQLMLLEKLIHARAYAVKST